MSRTVFNDKNKYHLTKKYPLFFADQLGLYDTVNTTYPRIEELMHKQSSQIWNEFEVALGQDKMDMLEAPRDAVDLMALSIKWQHMTDSVAGRSIPVLLLRHITNPEAEGMVMWWGVFENIHPRTYSHIVKQTMSDPQQSLVDVYADPEILARSKSIIKVFDELYNMPDSAPLSEKRKKMALTLVTLFAMESISFMASFAVTFGIAETGVFQGIGELVSKIARDEQLHQHMAKELIRITRDVEQWPEYEEIKVDIKHALDTLIENEESFIKYMFSKGRSLIGITPEVLTEGVHFFATPVYEFLKIETPFTPVYENPCSYMEKYLDKSLIQTANMELQHTDYRIGAINDDVDDDTNLDFDL